VFGGLLIGALWNTTNEDDRAKWVAGIAAVSVLLPRLVSRRYAPNISEDAWNEVWAGVIVGAAIFAITAYATTASI
jgi:hypothetical protein